MRTSATSQASTNCTGLRAPTAPSPGRRIGARHRRARPLRPPPRARCRARRTRWPWPRVPALGPACPPGPPPPPARSSHPRGSSSRRRCHMPARCDGLIRQLGIDLRLRRPQLERRLHRSHEPIAVVLQGAGMTDLVPQRRPLGGIRLQGHRLAQEGKAVVDLVSADGQFGRPPQTTRRHARAGASTSVVLAGPGEVEVLGADRFGIVVGQQWAPARHAPRLGAPARRRRRRAAVLAGPWAGFRRPPPASARA